MSSSRRTIPCSSCKRELDENYFRRSDKDGTYCLWCYIKKTKQDCSQLQDEDQAGPSRMPENAANPSFKPQAYALWRGMKKSFFSKKPLRCPRSDCKKVISVLSFTSHCQYEHKNMPIIVTNPGCVISLDFHPRQFVYDNTYCLMILSIPCFSLSAEEVQLSSDTKGILKESAVPAIALMGSKISGKHLKCFNSGQSTNAFPEQHLPSPPCMEPWSNIMFADDIMIFWLASNFKIKKNYTLSMSTTEEDLQQKYYGPIRSMHVSNLNMFEEGDGLTLLHFHINRMTLMGTKPLIMNAVVHDK